ncbi:MAG: Rieske 2Fe-2S domain-containing protein [Actinobacteria bacterium]|nr:Rieske 2Fe-2S domain-containing protein [Actinomycetota bacterium]
MDQVDRVVRRIETTEALDRVGEPVAAAVSRATRPTPLKNALSGTWLGHHLHPLLTDIPIGSWIAATLLDISGSEPGGRAARRLVGFGTLSVVPAALAGASDWAETYGREQRVGLVHALANITAACLQTASYLARRRGNQPAGIALSAGGLAVMTGAAYLGGHLAYVRGTGVNHTAFQEPTTEWADVGAMADLPQDKPVGATATGVPVVLVRRGDEVYALSATCVHAGGPLAEGSLANGSLRCPWHGSVFRLSDGKALRGPAATAEPAWQVRLKNGRVLVRLAAG